MADKWLLIGLALAFTLIFTIGVAAWTRWTANSKIQGQTIWHVVVGVAGTVIISGLHVGFDDASFVLVCFGVAFMPMAYEYFTRMQHEEAEAQKTLEESTNVNASADRETRI